MSNTGLIKQRAWQFTFAMLFVFNLMKAQTVWNRTYIDDRPTMLFSGVVAMDSIYYVSGVTTEFGLSYGRILIAKIDKTGNMISYQSVYDSTSKIYGAFLNALIQNDKNELVYAGYSGDSLPRLLLLKKNLTNDSITIYEYTTPNSYAYAGYTVLQDGSDYFVAGVQTDLTVNSADNVLLKIDSAGNRLWQKYYGVSGLMEYTKSILKLNNGNLMLGSFKNDFNQTHEHSYTWLLEVNDTGGIVRQWFDPNDSTYATEGLKQTQDSGFIYGAQKKFLQTVNDVYKTATIVKMDYNFNKQWTFNDGDYNDITGIYDIEELPDGSFVGCGNKPVYNGDPSVVSGWVVKLSSNGSVIWNKVYRGINASQTINQLTDIDVLPDGNLIAVGQCQQSGATHPQVGWFLKLDSNGCEIENCTVGIDEPRTESQDTKQIAIYPNPFITDLSIAIKAPFGGLGGATFTITNAIGQTLYRKQETNLATGYTKMLDLSYLPNGVYFVEVTTTSPNLSKGEGFHAVTKVVKQ